MKPIFCTLDISWLHPSPPYRSPGVCHSQWLSTLYQRVHFVLFFTNLFCANVIYFQICTLTCINKQINMSTESLSILLLNIIIFAEQSISCFLTHLFKKFFLIGVQCLTVCYILELMNTRSSPSTTWRFTFYFLVSHWSNSSATIFVCPWYSNKNAPR